MKHGYAPFVIRLTGTDLWLSRDMVIGYGMSHEYSHNWVLSPLSASRWETMKGAAEDAEKGIPIGHFEIYRLLESTEPVGTKDKYHEEAGLVKVSSKCMPVCGDKRNAWCRFWNCGE